MRRRILIPLMLGLTISGAASATQVTREFTFTATTFKFAFGPGPAPIDPVTGKVVVSFDDSADVENVTSGLTFNSFNVAIDTASALPAYTFHTDYFGGGPVLEIGTVCTCGLGSVEEIGPMADGFLLGIFDPAGTGSSGFFGYSQAAFDDVAFADSVDIVATSVPEPGIWSLTIAGLGLSGTLLRRGRGSAIPGKRACLSGGPGERVVGGKQR